MAYLHLRIYKARVRVCNCVLLLRRRGRRVDCQREVYHPEEEDRIEEEDPQLVGQERQVDERGWQKHGPIFEQRRHEGRLQLVLCVVQPLPLDDREKYKDQGREDGRLYELVDADLL
eukprot:CAMPEP_0182538582 /NCGR_PEP_ID=MMETSP1323-20130603/23911_1 /TAXON_ID=236787 /ORGANISM="Florenciella parvula, Strain RCC1693" /LENGTH=116 /DNA_ID=CAMNT_0024749055 /DNA_START=33 /DNA_END=383 /DNA_ORIENTATION=+